MGELFLLQNGAMLYALLFLALLGGALGLPIPEDIPLIFGGVLIQRGNGAWWVIALVCYVAVVMGDLIIFFTGRTFGPALLNSEWFRARIGKAKLRKVRYGLEKRSLLMIFIARHLFYLRSVTFLTCGAVRMRILRFVIADASAALISVPLMLWLGYISAEHYETVLAWFSSARTAMIPVTLIIIAGVILFIRMRGAHRVEDIQD